MYQNWTSAVQRLSMIELLSYPSCDQCLAKTPSSNVYLVFEYMFLEMLVSEYFLYDKNIGNRNDKCMW